MSCPDRDVVRAPGLAEHLADLTSGTDSAAFLAALRGMTRLLQNVQEGRARPTLPHDDLLKARGQLLAVARSKLATLRNEWNMDVRLAFRDLVRLFPAGAEA